MELIVQEVTAFKLATFIVSSLGIALFYTAIVPIFYGIEKIPSWFFFALFPSIIVVVFFIDNRYIGATVIGMVGFLVFLTLFGIALKFFSELYATYKKRRKKESVYNIIISVLKGIAFAVVSGALLLLFGPASLILFFFFMAFQFIISPSSESRFLRLQASLPTSKLRSMAMGLVEVRGKTKIIDPLISRIKEKECIGYIYTVESISTDSDGDTHYSTISEETVCNPFLLVGKTGEVVVEPEGIDFLWINKSDSYSSGSKRYSQALLLPNVEALIIGKANSKDNKNFIERDNIKKVFALAPIDSVTRWNRFRPLLNSMLSYGTVFLIIVAVILISKVEIKEESIDFSLPTLSDTINNFEINEILKNVYE